jgi:gliding motility-associated-like protein
MENFTYYSRYVLLSLLLLISFNTFAQRKFATTQRSGATGVLCLGCTVTNNAGAIDANLQTYSTLNVTLGVLSSTYQELIFPGTDVPANTPVTVKLGTGDNLLDLAALGSVSIRPFNGGTAAGPAVTAASLVTVASNNNQYQLTVTPTQPYDRIRVTLNGGLAGALSSVYLYDAYYNGNADVACNNAFDELHGVSSALLGLGVNVGGVSNPQRAIDGNINTFSTLNAGVAVVGAYAQQTILYERPSAVGDSVRLTLSVPQTLIDAGVLANLSVSTFNGNTNNNDAQALNGNTLDVRLLDLSNSRRTVTVTYAPPRVFDRVQLRLGSGIASVLSSINLHEAERLIPRPVVTVNGSATNNPQVCAGSAVTLVATGPANTTFTWYSAATGGSITNNGASFTTPVLNTPGNYYYYVGASHDGCTDGSESTRVVVTVNPLPASVSVAADSVLVCAGNSATFTAPAVAGITVKWYASASGGTALHTGNTFTTPALNATTRYYAEATNATDCPSAQRTPVTAVILETPALAANAITLTSGQRTTLLVDNPQPGAVYRWYTAETGGTLVHTGVTFVTPALTANTTYYVEAGITGCATDRAQVTITVNSAPDVVVTPPTQSVNAGETAVFTASSSTANATFRWYTTPTGGTPIFTGAVFTTPPVDSTTTYFAEAVNSTTNLPSPNRATGTVTVNGSNNTNPDVVVTPPTQSVNPGGTVTFEASSSATDVTFNWYTAPTGGTPVFTGPTFTTPPVNGNTTYYAEAVTAAGDTSDARATGTVTINGNANGPDVSVTPPTAAVNAGQTVTFTASSDVPNATFKWYTTPVGGTSVHTGATFTTPPVIDNVTYYAEAINPSSGAVSQNRASGTVTVNSPDVVVTPPTQSVTAGDTATFTASSSTPGTTFNWYTTPTGGTPIFTGATFTTPPVNATTTYFAEAVNPGTGQTSATRATGTVTVAGSNNNKPDVVVNPPIQSVNSGARATLTASSTTANATFKWYTTPTGGTPIFTGATFTTPPVTANTTYYAEAVTPGGVASANRATGTVNINTDNGNGGTRPSVAVTPPVRNIDAGETPTFTASSTTPNATFKWYTTPTGGTPVFTGKTFTTPVVTSNTTYYAEATDPATNLTSQNRATATVNINRPDVVVTPPTQNVSAGTTATFTASSSTPGTTFNWYTTPTGGTAVFTGATLTTPPVNADVTYYAEAVNPATGQTSATRATGTVTVSGGNNDNSKPDVVVNPPIQTVNSGSRATLTASSTTANVTFRWYTTPTGGTPVFTGKTFTTPPVTANTTYYAEAVTPGGAVSASRATGSITVSNGGGNNGTRPSVAVTPSVRNVNAGETATFTASSATPNATFNWYTTPIGGTPIFTGAIFTTSPVTSNTTYYAEATDPATNLTSQNRASGTANVNRPDVVVTPPLQAVDAGQSATFTASSTTPNATFNWYTTPTGGTPIFTGPVFTTPAVNSSTTYYAEAVNPGMGSTSPMRATGTVTVSGSAANTRPDVVVTPALTSVRSGGKATFTASSTTPNATFKWYTSPTGGTAIYTGAIFITPAIATTTTYYAEATNPATGERSSNRATGTALVVNRDVIDNVDVKVAPPAVTVNPGGSGTFTATSTTPGATFNWYTTPTGGTPVFTGSTFTTPPANSNITYYVEAVDPDGNTSTNRATAAVTVNEAGGGNSRDLFVPNAFTPNNDGNNDVLFVYGSVIQKLNFTVYDQWGEMQFRSNNVSSGWDGTWKGTAQPVGVYVYYVEATLGSGQVIKKKGTVTLIR